MLCYVPMVAKFVDPNKPWTCKYGRKKRVFCVLCDSTQEQKRRSILFFHRLTIEMAVSVKNDCWDLGIFLPWQCDATFLLSIWSLSNHNGYGRENVPDKLCSYLFWDFASCNLSNVSSSGTASKFSKKVKLVVVCLYKTFHWHDWRFNRAVACSADEFCSASDEINAGSPSWMLRLTEGWASQKVILKERTTGWK